jgi:hypothetical protein
MLQKFAGHVSDDKDWCSYWEIDRTGRPSPYDYYDTARFWYNLPANFDLMDACYRMFLWSGDTTYLNSPVFLNLYKRTIYDYTSRWDLTPDSLMSRKRLMNVRGRFDPTERLQLNRGIPSYEEGNPRFTIALDQVAAEYAGFVAYARILQFRGEQDEAGQVLAQAAKLRSLINREWWNGSRQSFFSVLGLDQKPAGEDLGSFVLYYGAAENGSKTDAAVQSILRRLRAGPALGVEAQSYLPEILYRHSQSEAAYTLILTLTGEANARRAYPEVSYAVIGAIVTGLMGVSVEPENANQINGLEDFGGVVITTRPRLTPQTQWAELQALSIRTNEISIRHEGLTATSFSNLSGPSLVWRACFPGKFSQLFVGEKSTPAAIAQSDGAQAPESCVTVDVGANETKIVRTALPAPARTVSPTTRSKPPGQISFRKSQYPSFLVK